MEAGGNPVNATYALIAILSLGLLLRLWRKRSSTVGPHPVGTPRPPGAERLDYWRDLLLQLPPQERLVAICELHRDGAVDTDIATTLIDEVG